MATKIDLSNVVESTTNFVFDFKYIKFKGIADIPAREMFLAILELDRFGTESAEDEIIKTMDYATKEELRELLPKDVENPKEVDASEIIKSNEDIRACINRHIMRNNLPRIEDLDNRLLYSIVTNQTKYVNLVLNLFLSKSKDNGSLRFTWDENVNLSSSSMDSFISDCDKAGSFNEIAQTLFLYLKSDYKGIYEAFYKSVIDFFSVFK